MTDSREHLDIIVLKREVEHLPSVEAAWAVMDPEDRVGFRAEWHDLMDVFDHLVDAYDRRSLDGGDVDALRLVVTALVSALPMMERLRLRLQRSG